MTQIINFLQYFGDQMLEYILFPLLVWTCIAIPITGYLRWTKSMPAVYQYHSRIALALVLPLGIAGALLTDFLAKSSETASTAFIVVQNPITVGPGSSESSLALTTYGPNIWLGLLGTLVVLGIVLYLCKMATDFVQLKKMEQHLQFQPLHSCSELADALSINEKHDTNTLLAYSNIATIPFTYGWRKTKIVIPSDLKTDSQNLAMAVQHELMHIKHRDYLLNGLLVFIKAVFWFHPLVHYLHNSSQEYREITCDSEVLANKQFSKKKYASLLYKLAKREHQTQLAMSMAINPSSLKKRIQIMSSQTNISSKFRSSVLMTVVSATLVVLTISCTDMAENGITNSEVQQAQSQIQSTNQQQLFFVNGEQVTSDEKIQKLSRLKSKYIKSIDILKGDKAVEKYGPKAKDGVVELHIWNETKQKAFTDLKEENSNVSDLEHQDFFVEVEQMPEIKGGLAGLQKKINYPEMAQKAGIEGRVIVQFIVNKQGEVENPQVIRGIGGGADKEAIRVVKQAQFEPGMQKGQPVRVQYSLPITYKLPDSKNES
ncbi:TonB family C-terminal domain-containing protein [Fodinibius salinus]|uniref:TonB family C-terminal domain-containing protein n=1 Tax=Fodinibius salinus TaxID=860790 RepID=A0A5D3YLJ5_9BACT|nr:M56 family metallopeptidase [Fodinibius salinus]TYP94750.1 TonB family C-terminal domain-containing protein [Fodinibius salinus]